jgi:ubiquitin-conjugating enzyme E2 Q
MSLSVPPVSTTVTRAFANYNYHQPQVNSPTTSEAQVGLDIKLDLNHQEIIFEEGQACPVQAGHWIVVSVAGTYHSSEQNVLDTGTDVS